MNKYLRYGYILFMTDQDLDGIHITGLGFNLFHTLWDSLIRLNKIGFMNTCINIYYLLPNILLFTSLIDEYLCIYFNSIVSIYSIFHFQNLQIQTLSLSH